MIFTDQSITIIRTYATYEIHWDRGSRWTGFRSAAEAQATVDFAASRPDGSIGHVVERQFTVEIPADRLGMYQPGNAGIADEVQS